MSEDEAWMKITEITNRDEISATDIQKVRSLKQLLSEEQQLWVEEALFLIEGSR